MVAIGLKYLLPVTPLVSLVEYARFPGPSLADLDSAQWMKWLYADTNKAILLAHLAAQSGLPRCHEMRRICELSTAACNDGWNRVMTLVLSKGFYGHAPDNLPARIAVNLTPEEEESVAVHVREIYQEIFEEARIDAREWLLDHRDEVAACIDRSVLENEKRLVGPTVASYSISGGSPPNRSA